MGRENIQQRLLFSFCGGLPVERLDWTFQSGHNGHMKTVNISDLKNHLSAHLEYVQAGDPVLILDRRRPVAVIEPLDSGTWSAALEALVVKGTVQAPATPPNPEEFLRLPRGEGAGLQSAILEERDVR